MVVRISDKTQNYSKVTKLLVKPTIIGAGAIVVKDCLESGTYVGSPAKKIK